MIALPNPFFFGPPEFSRQALIDAECLRAVEEALEPLPIFLQRAKSEPRPQSGWLDWLHDLGELAS